MENKYQIAFDFVKKSYPQGSKKWKQNVDTLQELIDKTTICGLSLDEAIPVIEMYRQLKHTTHQLDPIEDLMMGQKGQYYINGYSIEQIIQEGQRLEIENIELKKIIELKEKARNW